ncbi:MAG: hypothetical protein AAF569_08010, partial [Pseudomonadota bacterium]
CFEKTMKIQGKQAHRSVVQLSSLFDAIDLWFFQNLKQARQIFSSKPSKRLQLALASHCTLFKLIFKKFVSRRIQHIYRS